MTNIRQVRTVAQYKSTRCRPSAHFTYLIYKLWNTIDRQGYIKGGASTHRRYKHLVAASWNVGGYQLFSKSYLFGKNLMNMIMSKNVTQTMAKAIHSHQLVPFWRCDSSRLDSFFSCFKLDSASSVAWDNTYNNKQKITIMKITTVDI